VIAGTLVSAAAALVIVNALRFGGHEVGACALASQDKWDKRR
jgi:hypothetical protein